MSQSLAQAAGQQADAQINPQLAAQNSFNARQNQAIQGFAQALLGKLQPVAGQVGSDYDKAIGQTAALSNQSAQFLQNANPNPQVQALLQGAGAPQAQQDQVASALQSKFGGGGAVLSFLGGTVPGSALAADKAAMQGQAAQLPGFAALKGQQDLASALGTQSDARAKVLATRPAIFQQAENQISTVNRANAAQTEKVREYTQTRADKASQFATTTAGKKEASDFLNWYRTEGVKLTEARVNQKAQEFGVTTQQKNAQIGIAQQNANTSASRAASSTANADARLKLAQRHEATYERTAAGKASKKTSGLSATAYSTNRKQALKQADLFYYGKQPSATNPNSGIPGIDYGPALKQLVNGYSLNTRDAQAILNDFYAPGERGRPKKPAAPWGSPGSAAAK